MFVAGAVIDLKCFSQVPGNVVNSCALLMVGIEHGHESLQNVYRKATGAFFICFGRILLFIIFPDGFRTMGSVNGQRG